MSFLRYGRISGLSNCDDQIINHRIFIVEGYYCSLFFERNLDIAHSRNSCQTAFDNVGITSEAFTTVLTKAGIKISMDGRGCWMDNVFIERL